MELTNPYELHQQLLNVILTSKKSFIAMGKLLSELREDDRFKEAVGEGIDTWNAYIAQPEIGLSKGEAERVIQIYDQFVKRLGFSEDEIGDVPVKHMHYLLPIAKSEERDDEMSELLESAKTLSQKDFKDRVYEMKHGAEAPMTFEYIVMKRCVETGSLQKVSYITSELIENAFGIET